MSAGLEEQFSLFDLSEEAQNLIVGPALTCATRAAAPHIASTHILQGLLESMSEEQAEALQKGIAQGALPSHIEQILRGNTRPRSKLVPNITGAFEDFTPQAQDVLRTLYRMADEPLCEGGSPTPLNALTVNHIWVAVLSNPEAVDKESLGDILDFQAAAQAFADLVCSGGEGQIVSPNLYEETSDEPLIIDFFSEISISVLEQAAESAATMGYDTILPVHVMLAIIARPDSIGEYVIRRNAKPGVGPTKVIEEIERNITHGFKGQAATPSLNRASFSKPLQAALERAYVKARQAGTDEIDEGPLLYGMIAAEIDQQGHIIDLFKMPTLEIDLNRMMRHVEQWIKESAGAQSMPVPFLIPRGIAKSEDLTFLARMGRLPAPADISAADANPAEKTPMDQILRGLYRQENNHILVTGPAGIGKTTLMHALAHEIASRRIPFLKRKKLVWVDCSEIFPEESREKLESIITAVKGRSDVIVCLDHLENVVKFSGQREANNLSILRNALQNRHIHLIGITDERYFNELLASEYQLLKLFTQVKLPEPGVKTAKAIMGHLKASMEKKYRVCIDDEAMHKAVLLSKEYVMSERQPAIAIDVLVDACELANYEREMQVAANPDAENPAEPPLVTAEHVITSLAERTGIPEGTLRGTGEDVDFEAMLAASVVGQDDAVQAVTRHLRLIKGGLKDPSKPAAVLVFAGMTGVGKTELAKAVAQVYSASKTLKVYTMENYGEAHSVSGIVGVPPGYVGYEEGGKLIKDLNSDPYSVVLLDEIDKPHPEIWKVFLNLFDEGWITDTRNVKAYGNRAIFILTSNAGAEKIAEMVADGRDSYEIQEAVKAELLKVKHKHSNMLMFSPEFLARMSEIIIFGPLRIDAMRNVTRIKLEKRIREWKERRGKELVIDPAVAEHIATISDEANRKSGDKRGARVVNQNLEAMVDAALETMIRKQQDAFRTARRIHVTFDEAGSVIAYIEPAAASIDEATERAQERIRSVVEATDRSPAAMERTLKRIEEIVAEWEADAEAFGVDAAGDYSAFINTLERVRSALDIRQREMGNLFEQEAAALVDGLGQIGLTPAMGD